MKLFDSLTYNKGYDYIKSRVIIRISLDQFFVVTYVKRTNPRRIANVTDCKKENVK